MIQILSACMILVTSTVCAFAQTVDGPYTLLDHRFLAPSAQAMHNGRLFVSYFDRPGLEVFDSSLTSSTVVEALAGDHVTQMLHLGDLLLAVSSSSTVWYLDDASSEWTRLGVYDCPPFIAGNDLYVLSSGKVLLIRNDGTEWRESVVGTIGTVNSKITSFAVARDRILYSTKGSKDIVISTLNGVVVHSVQSHSPVDGFFLLADGSIAITANSLTSQVLLTDSLSSGGIGYLYYENSLVSLTNASACRIDTVNGLIGTFNVSGTDPREGVYVVTSPISIMRRKDLDSMLPEAISASFAADTFVLSTYGHIVVADERGTSKRARWFADTVFGFADGVSFTPSGTPFMCGDASVNGVSRPTSFPTNPEDPPRLLRVADPNVRLLVRSVQLAGGPEIAFCSFGVYRSVGDSVWEHVYSSNSDFRSRLIDVVNDSLIVVRSIPRHILLSNDKGMTWRLVAIKDYLTRMSPVISSGTMLYTLSQGVVRAVDISIQTDSVAPPTANLSISYMQRLFSCNDDEVYSVTARSDSDPSYLPSSYTHVTCHRWVHADLRLDSVTHHLATPLVTSNLTEFVRKDTAYIWSYNERRLLAITYSGIVYDTILPKEPFGAFGGWSLPVVVNDNDGNLWMFNSSQVTGYRFDPSKPVVSSVQEYYSYLYIGSIRPNPATDNTRVTLGRFAAALEEEVRLYLVDLNGVVIRNFTNTLSRFPGPTSTQDVEINVDGLPRGVYLLVIENKQGKSASKLVVTP